jgi:hypothetical protein
LTTASRPKVDDDTIFVEQHSIQAARVALDITALPAEAYTPQAITGVLAVIGINPREPDAYRPTDIGHENKRVLEQKIIRILAERASLTV